MKAYPPSPTRVTNAGDRVRHSEGRFVTRCSASPAGKLQTEGLAAGREGEASWRGEAPGSWPPGLATDRSVGGKRSHKKQTTGEYISQRLEKTADLCIYARVLIYGILG